MDSFGSSSAAVSLNVVGGGNEIAHPKFRSGGMQQESLGLELRTSPTQEVVISNHALLMAYTNQVQIIQPDFI